MSKLIQNPEELEKSILLKHALDRVLNLYSVDRVYVYPIVDVLKLIIQRPVIVSFFSNANRKHLVYTSAKDPETLAVYAAFIKRVPLRNKFELSDQISMEFYILNDSPEEGQAQLRGLTDDEFEKLHIIVNDLFSKDNDAKRRRDGILQAVKEYEKKFGPDESQIESLTHDKATKRNRVKVNVSDENIRNFRKSMRQIVDLSMHDFNDAILVRIGPQGEESLPFSNLFFVFRFPSDRKSFDYSAQIILSTRQLDEIRSWWEGQSSTFDYMKLSREFLSDSRIRKNVNIKEVIEGFTSDIRVNPTKLLEMVETPLSFEATSIADSIFKSGVIDFSHFAASQGLDWNAHQEADIRRQLAEHIIYSRITGYRHPFYIPIHVGGIPWLLLFTMPPQRYDRQTYADWKHNLNFYVDFIPFLSNKIRATARDLYLSRFSEIIQSSLAKFFDGIIPDQKLLCNEINESTGTLMKFFPYDTLLFCDNDNEGGEFLDLHNGKGIWFKMRENSFFEKQVGFDLIDLNSLQRAAQNGVERAELDRIESERRVSQLRRVHELVVAHDTPALIEHGILDPLRQVIQDSTLTPKATDSLEKIRTRVRNFLGQIISLMKAIYSENTEVKEAIEINEEEMANLIEQLKGILDDGGTFPQVKTIFDPGSKVKVNKGCLASIFRQLFRNAIEAMRRSEITPKKQEVIIHFKTCHHEEAIYCEILFYNSGTKFLQSILDWGGLTFKTSNLEGGHSGLGLYIVERLLQSIHSPLLEGNRHFELLNLETGAQVKFCLPIIAESDSN